MLKYFLPIALTTAALNAGIYQECIIYIEDQDIYVEVDGHLFHVPIFTHCPDCPCCIFNENLKD